MLWLAVGVAHAADRHYVLPDGRKIPLVRSETELAVVFRSKADAQRAKGRIEAAVGGRVKDIEWATDSPIKIVQVGKAADRKLLSADPAVVEARPVYRFAGDSSPVIGTGKIAVRLRHELNDGRRAALWREFDVQNVAPFEGLPDVYIATLGDDGDDALRAEQLAADWRVVWANPSFRRPLAAMQVGVADPLFPEQWHLNNTGSFLGSIADADIDAPEAWSMSQGEGVLVGMFDDACDVDHEDLIGNYIGFGYDPALPATLPGATDPRVKNPGERHGTSVMGLAVASANELGVRGVAFRAQFTATRGLLDPLVGDEQVAAAYTFALLNDVDVHNNSWGVINVRTGQGAADPPVVVDAIQNAFRRGRDLDGFGPLPARGMVLVFSAGNTGAEVTRGFSLATLPEVIGVGSSTTRDGLSTTSSFGPEIDFLAPGSDPADGLIATTDNTDSDQAKDNGYNDGRFAQDFADTSYTRLFGGTSASCPIATGVAALVLSVNPDLTATGVRVLMEHTCDQVSPEDAEYDPVTGRSLTYAHGRINAHRAVLAAQATLETEGRSWPDRPTEARVDVTTLRWLPGIDTDDFLVVSSDTPLTFAPAEGSCYNAAQNGCSGATLIPLPSGVQLLSAGCTTDCQPTTEQSVTVTRPVFGRRFFGIFGHNSLGRYSFGAAAHADAIQPPAVTISASALTGASPLTVHFNGNAVSDLPIDPNRTTWDFNLLDTADVNARTLAADYTYVVSGPETRTFTARLTMYDTSGNAGSASVQIQVTGETSEEQGDAVATEIRILVGVPGSPGTDDSEGVSPFPVELRVISAGVGSVTSVAWDLGDGSAQASGLVVPHTYINEGTAPLVIPVSATITVATESGSRVQTATRVVTVHPGTGEVDGDEPDLPGTGTIDGGGASPCGAVGMIPLLLGFASLLGLRRRA